MRGKKKRRDERVRERVKAKLWFYVANKLIQVNGNIEHSCCYGVCDCHCESEHLHGA